MHHRHNLQISLPRRNTLTESPAPLVGFDRRQKRDKRKTESGKRKTFVFRVPLGVRKRNRRQTESRGCLHAMPRCEGGKASVAGLKRKTENFLELDGTNGTNGTNGEFPINSKCKMQNAKLFCSNTPNTSNSPNTSNTPNNPL